MNNKYSSWLCTLVTQPDPLAAASQEGERSIGTMLVPRALSRQSVACDTLVVPVTLVSSRVAISAGVALLS